MQRLWRMRVVVRHRLRSPRSGELVPALAPVGGLPLTSLSWGRAIDPLGMLPFCALACNETTSKSDQARPDPSHVDPACYAMSENAPATMTEPSSGDSSPSLRRFFRPSVSSLFLPFWPPRLGLSCVAAATSYSHHPADWGACEKVCDLELKR